MNEEIQQTPLKVFISYSVHDTAVVGMVNAHLQPQAQTFFWAQDQAPGYDAWTTIHSWIDQADLVVVVLTGNTLARALSVCNEVGHCHALAA